MFGLVHTLFNEINATGVFKKRMLVASSIAELAEILFAADQQSSKWKIDPQNTKFCEPDGASSGNRLAKLQTMAQELAIPMAIRHAGLESAYTQVQNLYDYLYQCVFLIGMDLGTKNKGFSIAATISMQNSFEAVNNFRQAIGSYSDIDERVPSLSSIWLDVRQDEIFLNAAMDAVPYLNSFQRLDLHRRYGEALSRASAVRRGMVEYACEDMAEKAPKAMTFIFGKLHKTESAPRVNI